MTDEWTLIESYTQAYLAEMAKDILLDNGVEALIFNRQDSSYLAFGYFELYVKTEQKELALEILKV